MANNTLFTQHLQLFWQLQQKGSGPGAIGCAGLSVGRVGAGFFFASLIPLPHLSSYARPAVEA
jgi:hypothetical protein